MQRNIHTWRISSENNNFAIIWYGVMFTFSAAPMMIHDRLQSWYMHLHSWLITDASRILNKIRIMWLKLKHEQKYYEPNIVAISSVVILSILNCDWIVTHMQNGLSIIMTLVWPMRVLYSNLCITRENRNNPPTQTTNQY